MLRRSAVVEVAYPCFPKAVVRLASTDAWSPGQDEPRLSLDQASVDALVNDLGPEDEVRLGGW